MTAKCKEKVIALTLAKYLHSKPEKKHRRRPRVCTFFQLWLLVPTCSCCYQSSTNWRCKKWFFSSIFSGMLWLVVNDNHTQFLKILINVLHPITSIFKSCTIFEKIMKHMLLDYKHFLSVKSNWRHHSCLYCGLREVAGKKCWSL